LRIDNAGHINVGPTPKGQIQNKTMADYEKDFHHNKKAVFKPLMDITSSVLNTRSLSEGILDTDDKERECFVRCMVIGTESTTLQSLIWSLFPADKEQSAHKAGAADFISKTLIRKKTTNKYHFWIRSIERESELKDIIWRSYYKWMSAFIFVYDATSKDSLTALEKTIQSLQTVIPQQDFFGILIANKSDHSSHREVSLEEALNFKSKYGFRHFIETSGSDEKEYPQILEKLDMRLKTTFEAV